MTALTLYIMYCSCCLLHPLSGAESWVWPLKEEKVLEKVGEKVFQVIIVIAFIIIRVSVIHFPLLSVRETTENIKRVNHKLNYMREGAE